MVIKKTSMGVDKRFFKDIFEKERKKMQNKLGLRNLSQINFSKMITGLEVRQPKQNLSHFNPRIKRRKNVKL